MLVQPVLVFEATGAKLRTVYERAVTRELRFAIYTADLFATGKDDHNRAAVRAVPSEELDLVGVALAGAAQGGRRRRARPQAPPVARPQARRPGRVSGSVEEPGQRADRSPSMVSTIVPCARAIDVPVVEVAAVRRLAVGPGRDQPVAALVAVRDRGEEPRITSRPWYSSGTGGIGSHASSVSRATIAPTSPRSMASANAAAARSRADGGAGAGSAGPGAARRA